MTSKQVRVVDDEPEIAEVMVLLLRDEDYAVSYVPSALIAVRGIQQERAALVLTDYMMPVMNGREILQKLRKHRTPSPYRL